MRITDERIFNFEHKHVDCVGSYHGPTFPGFPYVEGDMIHPDDIREAAALYYWAREDNRDRVIASM